MLVMEVCLGAMGLQKAREHSLGGQGGHGQALKEERGEENKCSRQKAWPESRPGAWKPEEVLFPRSTGHAKRRNTKQG